MGTRKYYKQFHATKLNNWTAFLWEYNLPKPDTEDIKTYITCYLFKKIHDGTSGQDGITDTGFTLPSQTTNKSQKIFEIMVFKMILNGRP